MNIFVGAKEMGKTETENWDGTEVVEQEVKRPGKGPKKVLVISGVMCGGIAFLLWATFGFPRKPCIIIFLRHPQTTKCSGKWIGVRDNCFYFSNDTKNWIDSKRFCISQGSDLAQIDTQETMEFLKKRTGPSMHWIGLSRNQGESWKWTNGTTFNTWFEITGDGSFAFLNAGGVYSSRGLIDIKWICSKPRF
uniref:C-type lectin domain family 2 member A n=1 Tax=Molossus molossus TaxID=27622 RepID=A0A7J8FW29_MOLMO|nr:C-type lectin domain family 2 member A [Molossus molossus]